MIKIIFIIIALIIAICVGVFVFDSKGKEIDQWADEKGYVIESKEVHFTIFGTPFYYLPKGQYIYEVKLTNGEKWWVRTGVFENDYEKE